jgi:ligand-binding SRPBCC domain-containing protein
MIEDGYLGSGKQWTSWIHIDDVVGIILWSLENSQAQGTINCVSPEPVTNKEFSKELAAQFQKKLGPPVPAAVLKIILGEMSTVILNSQKVHPKKLQALGYSFQFKTLKSALKQTCQYFQNCEFVFKADQYLPAPPEKVFPFFAEAENLEKITPPLLNFKIKKMSTEKIQKGTLIDYRLKIHGVPIGWRTEIQVWQPNKKFVDFQLRGPYKKWHHTHEFEALGPGTWMRDLVCYKIPLGWLGWLCAGHMVRRDIEKIFAYRREAVGEKRF